MSKEIMTTLRSKTKKLSGDKVKTGPCIFPYKYKGTEYNECYKGKNGDWCATEVDENGKMKKYAFCKTENKTEKKTSKKAKSKAKPTTSKPKSVKKKSVSKEKQDATAIPKSVAAPKAAPKKLKSSKFKVKNPLDGIEDKYLVKSDQTVVPNTWELPNRKTFPNWMFVNYKPYLAVKNSMKTGGEGKFSFFKHQKLVKDYLQTMSPYRGILLYHGLGVGKTCASIGIAEGFRSDRKIVILLNKSLKKNFRVNLMKCGYDYFRTNQNWTFVSLKKTDPLFRYARYLGISSQFIDKHGGCMIADFSKKPNYDNLSDEHRELLNNQINHMIDQKYEFIHIDGLNKKKLEKMVEDRILDNKLLIIDEVHNLTNAMSKDKPGFRAKYIKKLIMEAQNLKLVFLSGTPMINKLYEAGQMFNLLRGYIEQFVIRLTPAGNNYRSIASLEEVLVQITDSGLIDQIMLDKKNKVVSFTRLPLGFRNLGNEGIINDPSNDIENKPFIELLTNKLSEMGYKSAVTLEKHTAFPEEESTFLSMFFDGARNKIKNPQLFQARSMGLISYFKTNDKSLLPEVTKNDTVLVDMSDYQFNNYSVIRKKEIEQDKNKRKKKTVAKKKKEEEEGEKSSYRAYSRMHCSFVFPETIERPYPNAELVDEDLDLLENTTGYVDEDNSLDEDTLALELSKEKKAKIKQYERSKEKALKKLDKEKYDYLVVNDPEKLPKYSPKYNRIISDILKSLGNVFVYTEYRSLEGISVFQICLKANGYAPFLLNKLEDGDYEQVFENEEDRDKPKYALWGGDPEYSDIIRKVYNNEFSLLPPKLVAQIKSTTKTNLRGETIKVLLTTKTGAEGIDLKNVRQVHIIEPFWNPVRVNQVKGRAVRVASHVELPPKERKVEITTYLASIKQKHLKADRIIMDDSDGMSSDQVLFNISKRKLDLMEDLLKLINSASIDCALNRAETVSKDNQFECLSFGQTKERNYASIPDISKEVVDSERVRVVKTKTWEPTFIKIPIRGKQVEFAMKKSDSPSKPSILYSGKDLRAGIVTDPLGEIKVMEDGKSRITFYKRGGCSCQFKTKKNKDKK